MDRPVFKVVIFSECVVLISGIGMAPPSGMGGSETSEYSSDNTAISDVVPSVRTCRALQRSGIETIGDLRTLNTEDLLKVRNLGEKGD